MLMCQYINEIRISKLSAPPLRGGADGEFFIRERISSSQDSSR